MEERSLYGGRDPRELPTYSLREAARHIQVPDSTLSYWLRGRGGNLPVIQPSSTRSRAISFNQLIEAYALSSLKKEHGMNLKNIRAGVEYVQTKMGINRPFIRQRFQTDGVSLFVEHMGSTLNVSRKGQVAMKELMQAYLRRVEWDIEGFAERLYLFTRPHSPHPDELDQPKLVLIDPRISFGRPILTGTGIPTAIVAERHKMGEAIKSLTMDYNCSEELIEEALRYEYYRPKAA